MEVKNTDATGKKSKLERIEQRIAQLENRRKPFKPEKMKRRERNEPEGLSR